MTRARAAAVVVVGVATTVVLRDVPIAAAPPEACIDPATDFCVEDGAVYPGTPVPGPPAVPAERSQDSEAPADETNPRCIWVTDPGALTGGDGAPGAFPDVGTRPAVDAYLTFERCGDELTGQVRWVTPDATAPGEPAATTPAPQSPEQLATRVRVRLDGNLPQPVAATSPAAGLPAIVNHPTFLAIDNWTGAVSDEECAFLLCVTVTATPALTWDPGEPGAPTIRCAGAGTRFDPAGPPPHDQATDPDACAYAYQSRTGAAGRPDHWPGVATVTWTLTWTSTTGAGGTLPPVVRTTEIPRAVDEVQAIVIR